MKLVLSNSQIVDINSPFHLQKLDILIENGKMTEIGSGLKGDEVFDCSGMVVSPGLFDLFACFGEPGFEHREEFKSGIDAAKKSGFTDVCLIPNNDPITESKADVNFIKSRSEGGVNLHAYGAVSEGCKGENLTEILDLNHAGALAFTDGIHPVWNTELLLKAIQYVQKFDGLVVNRPKDIHLSQYTHMHEGIASTSLGLKGEPDVSEVIAIKRDLDILTYTGGRLHFTHLSSAKGVGLIRDAKKSGLRVSADVSINQLLYTDQDLLTYDTNLKVDPPFRTEADRQALIQGVLDGTIDAIVSSHLPYDPENKELEFDLATPGIASIHTLFSQLLKLTDQIPFEILIDRLTHQPRKIMGLKYCSITVGSDACLAIFDQEKEWELNRKTNPSHSENSPLFGQTLKGVCIAIFNQGQLYKN